MNTRWSRSRRQRVRHGPFTAGLALFAIIVCAHPVSIAAAEQARTVALGESNSEVQRTEVLELLDAAGSDQVVTVTVAETFQTMGGVFDLSGVDTAYSSTALTCTRAGSGIDVLTRNIEIIPPELYALALLTAGMSDVQLAVAAPTDAPALGMTALTGVFKTWEMASCSDSGSDPVRRQLALEELALIAEIGQEPEAIRQTTQIVLEAQREIVGRQVTTEELDAIVTARSQAFGLDLDEEDQAEIVEFLDRLSSAEVDWGLFRNGWSVEHADDGSGVVLTANVDPNSAERLRAALTGVGGRTGPIAAAPTPTVPPSPTVTPRTPIVMTPVSTSTPAMIDYSTPTIMGTVTARGDDGWRRWWPVALIAVPLLVLGLLAHRLFGGAPTTWLVSRGWTSGRAGDVRYGAGLPVAGEPAGRAHRVRISGESVRN